MHILTKLENLENQVSRQQSQLEVQTQLIANLQTRVSNQESAIAKQQATIDEQQAAIVEQQKTISEQQDEISQQQSNLAEQHHRLIRLESTLVFHRKDKENRTGITDTEKDRANQTEAINGVIQHIDSQPDEAISAHSNHSKPDATSTKRQLTPRSVLGIESPIAFHAVTPGSVVTHTGDKILFPTVMLNLGSGYHSQHSLFIAPAAGVYVFSTSIFSHRTHVIIPVSILKNGAVLARAWASDDTQGSVTIVTQLAIGDELWVGEYGVTDRSYYGDYYTSFMGCLLWAL